MALLNDDGQEEEGDEGVVEAFLSKEKELDDDDDEEDAESLDGLLASGIEDPELKEQLRCGEKERR